MQADEKQARAFGGHWWRFARYQVVGGRVGPGPGAHLETYDPWELKPKRGQPAPYVELARLGEAISGWHDEMVAVSLRRFRQEVARPLRPTAEEMVTYIDQLVAARAGAYPAPQEPPAEICELLTEWCARFGLLGILQQETLAVNLEATPEALLDLSEIVGGLADDQLVSRFQRFERAAGGWRTLSLLARTREKKDTHRGLTRRSWGELLKSTVWPLDESQLPPATVLRRGLRVGTQLPAALDLAPLAQVRSVHFGCSRHFYEPNTEEFWHAYSEDAVEFAGYAVVLARALSGVQDKSARKRAPHVQQLNDLLAPVALVVGEEKGVLRSRYVSPSLVGTLAAMAFCDIAGGVRFAHCEHCGQLFSSRRTDRRFCSTACQNAAKKRRRYHTDDAYRERQQALARARAAKAYAARSQQR